VRIANFKLLSCLHFAANGQNIHKSNSGATMGITRRRPGSDRGVWMCSRIPAIALFGPLLFPIARQMEIHEVL